VDFLFAPEQLRYDRPIRRRADFVEAGAYPTTLLAALEAAVTCLTALGTAAIEGHIHAYLDRLEAGLLARGFESLRSAMPEQRSGILGVRPPAALGDLEALNLALGERKVVTTIPDGVLRFAPHWPNPLSEIELVLAVIDELLA
jgi:selenocysteine lyase/cysteine desulfurase